MALIANLILNRFGFITVYGSLRGILTLFDHFKHSENIDSLQ
jgi:hypothetical protein